MKTSKPKKRGRVRSVEQRAQSGGGLVYVSSSAVVLILLTRDSGIACAVTLRFPYFTNGTEIKRHENSAQVSYLQIVLEMCKCSENLQLNCEVVFP
jgi:hypothetical protein